MSGIYVDAPASRFLTGSYTLDTLPDPAANAQKYAWVSDLFDSQPDLVISDGTYWKPVRPLAVLQVPNANTNMTLQCMRNSPTVIFKGALTLSRTVTLASGGFCYPGAKFRAKREATGLSTLLVNGIGLALNSWADFEYDGTSASWVQTASGGLL